MNNDTQTPHLTTAERFLALSQVGTALVSELDEQRLLHLIARTACDLTGATFAAFSLRPVADDGQPPLPAEGSLFHLAAVFGVTPEHEALFRRMPLGGEGLLAPIFRHGVPVLVADALAHLPTASHTPISKEAAQAAALAFAHGRLPSNELSSLGIPHGHPLVRSFLGAPLLDRKGEVRGGLLLGHTEPNQFTEVDKTILLSLAGQAAIALENSRLHQLAQLQALELQAIFDSISDGITLLDRQGKTRRENVAAHRVRQNVLDTPKAQQLLEALLPAPAQLAHAGAEMKERVVQVNDAQGEQRDYLVTTQSLYSPTISAGKLSQDTIMRFPHDEPFRSHTVVIWHDVTERRVREMARQAQERTSYLESIFEAIVDGVYVYDQQGSIVQINSAAQMLLAHTNSPGAEALPLDKRLGGALAIGAEGKHLTLEQLPITRILQGERLIPEHAVEVQMSTHDGGILHTSVTGGPIRDAHGQNIGAVVISRDITEQKLAQHQREQQAQQLLLQASLIELAHDAIIVRDPHSVIISWNRGAEALYGWTAQEVRDKMTHTLLQTHFPHSREVVDQLLELEGKWAGELVHTRRDGQTVIVESRQVLMRDTAGHSSAILEINRDITARRHLELLEVVRAQAESRLNLLQLILDELPSCVYLVRGPEARLVLANRALSTLFGAVWTPGQPMLEFLAQQSIRIMRPDGRPLEPEQIPALRVVQRGETVRQFQQVIRHADGTSLPVLANAVLLEATQLLGGTEQVTSEPHEPERAALVVWQDVTAIKEAEALKNEFLTIASHELRSPLAVLSGYAGMLLRQDSRGRGVPLTSWQKEGLQGINKATERLAELMGDLLDVTRLQGKRLDLSSEPTNLIALSEMVVNQQQITTQRHQLTLHTVHEQLVVNIDTGRLEQIITNLLSNAIKYSPQGGPIEITIEAASEAGEAVLSVRDHGMGIPAEQHARIFGRFVRADNARISAIAGTGLGLYLCRELIERYGGRIWFESSKDEGSTFFVALPVVVKVLL